MLGVFLVGSCAFASYFVRCVLCPSGLVAHGDLDERAIEALKEFNEDGALQVLVQFKESDLSHVQVSFKSCETWRERSAVYFYPQRQLNVQVSNFLLFLIPQNKSAFLCGVMKTYRQREKQGTKVSDSIKGPDEAKIKELLERTSYTLDVTTGQRKYGGPPPESVYSGSQPPVGTEVLLINL